MHRLIVRMIIALAAITIIGNNSFSQAISVSTAQATNSPVSLRGLNAPVAITVDRVPVKSVIQTIAQQAGLKVTFGDAVARNRKLITMQDVRGTAREVFSEALKGTAISYTVSPSGNLLFDVSEEHARKAAQGVIAGKVTDTKANRAVSGATVSLDNDTRGVMTDENGSYRITNVSSGTHTVTVRLLGYAKQTKSVTIGESSGIIAISVDFKLEPTANVLDQVVVTGTVAATELKAVPNAMTIITAKQIEERGITKLEQLFRGDVPGLYAINLMGGTSTDNYGQVVLFSRGATAINNNQNSGSTGISDGGPLTNNMKMYVDGVQLSDSSLKFLGQIDPKSIERMEILTGPQASTVYGAGAINGVIQIFTKRGTTSRPQFALNFSTGMAESNYKKHIELNNYVTNLSLSGLEGRVSYRMGTSWNHDGNWIAGQQANTFGGDGSVAVSLGSKITGRASTRWSRRFSSVTGAPGGSVPFGALTVDGVVSPGFGSSIVKQTASTGSQGGGLTLDYRQFPWWSHNATFGFDGNTYGRYQPAPKYGSLSDTSIQISSQPGSNTSQSYSSTMQLPLLSLASLNLTFGGDHSRSGMGNLGWYTDKMTGKILTVPDDNGGNIQAYQSKPNRHSGAYVQGRLGIKDALFFTYGVRKDWDPAYGDNADVTPDKYGATFNHSFGPLTAKLRGIYGRSIRAPKRDLTQGALDNGNDARTVQFFGKFYQILPNPELIPEDQQGGEGGMDLYFGNRGFLSVTRYNQTVDNLIERFVSDSTRSLVRVPVNFSSRCDSRGPFNDIIFDAEGYCYKFQQKALNVGSIRNQGWELTGTMNLGPMRTRGTYSWTKSRVLGITPQYRNMIPKYAGANFQVGAPFNYLPEHTWAFGMSYDYSSGTISLDVDGHGTNLVPINNTILGIITTSDKNRLTYTRNRMAIPSGVASLAVPGYSNAYLNASHRFSRRINATLNVSNLTNYYKNDYNASFPSQGRTTRLGANVTW